MRIFKVVLPLVVIGLALGLGPTLSLDGTPAQDAAPSGGMDLASRSSVPTQLDEKKSAVTSLQYAAEHGHSVALWQLGRIYAQGDGVQRDDMRAFEYFRKFADGHADDNPAMPRSRFVADAFVALGRYYLVGIPNSPVQPNAELAHRMFRHAASYFGDPEAQYQLAMLYVDGNGVTRDSRRAIPWLSLAARKGHYKAQALLGRILFTGEHGERQQAAGLMWLTIACDGPGGKVPWIAEARETAFKQATDRERASALGLLERWVEGRRD